MHLRIFSLRINSEVINFHRFLDAVQLRQLIIGLFTTKINFVQTSYVTEMLQWSKLYHLTSRYSLATRVSWFDMCVHRSDKQRRQGTSFSHLICLIKYKQLGMSLLRIFEVTRLLIGDNRARFSRNEFRAAASEETRGSQPFTSPFPLRLIMQFSSEAFFTTANSQCYSRRPRARSRLVRHPICISRAPFRDLHSAGHNTSEEYRESYVRGYL